MGLRKILPILRSYRPRIRKWLEKMPNAAGRFLRGLPQWFIRGLMALFALLIVIDLVALAVLVLGNLTEPVVLMLDANASINNYTAFNISKFINNCSIINNYEIAKNSTTIALEFWTIYRNTNAVSLITFLAALLLGMIFASIFKKEKGLLVLPFNVEISKDKSKTHALSSSRIQNQFIANLNKIHWIHRIELEGIDPEHKVYYENVMLRTIKPKSESPTYDLSKLGTISIGSIGLSIGEILMLLREVCPGADPGRIIKGDLNQSGSEIRLTATIGPESTPKGSYSWSICGSLKGRMIEHKKIFDLLSDLCYQIAYEFLPPDNSINDWMAFKYFTEARFAYRQYTITKDGRSLDKARDYAFKAANSSPNYDNLFALIYNLGIAYLNEKKYKEAEALFRMNVILKRESYEGYRGWGMALRRLDMNDMALMCFNKANEILTEKSELHKSHEILVHKGILFRNQKNYEKAIDCFEKALEKNPNLAFAWGHMGNTLEALSRYFRLKAIYKLFEFMVEFISNSNSGLGSTNSIQNSGILERFSGMNMKKRTNNEKNIKKIKKLKEEMDRGHLSEEEALEELLIITSESLSDNYKDCHSIIKSLYRLGHDVGKNCMAREIEVKFRSLGKECGILAKLIRKTTPGAREFEDKCTSSAQDLIDLIDKYEFLLGPLGKKLKINCECICDQCQAISAIFRDNVTPFKSCHKHTQWKEKTMKNRGDIIENICKDIKNQALNDMQTAENGDDALKNLKVANLIEDKGLVLKNNITTLATSFFCTDLGEDKFESEDRLNIIKRSWYIRTKCCDLNELLNKYLNENKSKKENKILNEMVKEVEDLSKQCKEIREIFEVKGRSSKIKAVEIAKWIEGFDKKKPSMNP